MLAQIPEIDRTTQVKPVRVPGGFIWGVNFKLPVPAEQDGFIIQKIRQVETDRYENPTYFREVIYWESWEIKKGETTPKQSQTVADFVAGLGGKTPPGSEYHIPVNDIFYRQYTKGNKGRYLIQGLAGFYHDPLPADFIVNHSQTGAGQLKSTILKPSFWEKSCLYRQLIYNFDCSETTTDDSKNHINNEINVWDFRPFAKAFGF
jgi:hypothetical protein